MYDMEGIIKRLFENRKDDNLDISIFDMKGGSDESYDLLDLLDNKVRNALIKYGMDDVDLDDNGLDGNPKPTSNRSIIYKTQIYRFKDGKTLPLNKKEQSSIISALTQTVRLPDEDDEYEYSVEVDIAGTELSIVLRRSEIL